jgi:hypothetical protein
MHQESDGTSYFTYYFVTDTAAFADTTDATSMSQIKFKKRPRTWTIRFVLF